MSEMHAVTVANFGGPTDAEVHRWDEFAALDELSFRKQRLNQAEEAVEQARQLLDDSILRHIDKLGSARIAQRIGVTRQTVYNAVKRTNG